MGVRVARGARGNSGIAILKRSGGYVELTRVLPSKRPSATTAAAFVDTQKMIDGSADPVASSISGARGSIYANKTVGDKVLFVAEENGEAITVIDPERARCDGYKPADVIGKIPVGLAPIALTFSSDGKCRYTTSQGPVIVIDIARAKMTRRTLWRGAPACCKPDRVSISPKGHEGLQMPPPVCKTRDWLSEHHCR